MKCQNFNYLLHKHRMYRVKVKIKGDCECFDLGIYNGNKLFIFSIWDCRSINGDELKWMKS